MSKSQTDMFWNERPKTQSDIRKVNIDDLVQRDLEATFIAKHLNPEFEILEVGCGNGYFTTFLRDRVKHVDSFDYSENMISQARNVYGEKNNKFFHDNLLNPQSVTKTYDAVVCVRVLINLQSLAEQKIALKNLLSWVKPGGVLILVEGFIDGFDEINKIREAANIDLVKPASINFYSKIEEFAEGFPKEFNKEDTFHTGSFDFLTRVVYPFLVEDKQGMGPSDFHEKIKVLASTYNPEFMKPFARLHGWALKRQS